MWAVANLSASLRRGVQVAQGGHVRGMTNRCHQLSQGDIGIAGGHRDGVASEIVGEHAIDSGAGTRVRAFERSRRWSGSPVGRMNTKESPGSVRSSPGVARELAGRNSAVLPPADGGSAGGSASRMPARNQRMPATSWTRRALPHTESVTFGPGDNPKNLQPDCRCSDGTARPSFVWQRWDNFSS